MHTFKDKAGRERAVDLTVGLVERCRQTTGIDLLETLTGDLWGRLLDSPVKAAAVARALTEGQWPDEATFQAEMRGDTLDAFLIDALQPELLDFFPRRRRPMLAARMLEDITRLGRTITTLEAAVASPPPTSGPPSGGPPASAESTPAA